MHVAGMIFNEIANGCMALGNPRSFVEQRCSLEERRHVEFDNSGSEAIEHANRGRPSRGRRIDSEKAQIVSARNADHRFGRCPAQSAQLNRA